ncbi:DUF3035 domain-containing protein [Candidatus Pelagibacter sp.]|nr:DUF3035 domain-containing protein [Candidatus Pelagibacter sp.]
MKKINLTIILLALLVTLNACGSISEGLGATKKKGGDEFLVEKKAPLVLPPNLGELPEPGIKIKESLISSEDNSSSVTEIIKKDSNECISSDSEKKCNTIEKSIIEKILLDQ